MKAKLIIINQYETKFELYKVARQLKLIHTIIKNKDKKLSIRM